MKTIFTAIALVILAGTANAATIITETTDFTNQDLTSGPLSITPGNVFSTPGAYSVSGSLTDQDNSDTFTAVLGPNRILENIIVSFSNVAGAFSGTNLDPSEVATTTAITAYFPGLPPAPSPQFGFTSYLAAGNSTTDFSNALNSLADDQTWVFGFGLSPNSFAANFGSLSGNWNITFDVVDTSAPAVPLPASALLLVGGLAGLGLVRRRTMQARS